jgi:SAM-dependent methyltransferase
MSTDLPAAGYAPDGSPVPLYQRLPPRTGEAALIHELLPTGGTVLDLGCGTGRLAEPLVDLGHPVTGVDNEPQMLAGLRRATGVLADVTTVELSQHFDAVLLMSHLVNTAEHDFVAAVLRTARRHLDGGVAVVERYPPGWVGGAAEIVTESGGVRYTLQRHDLSDDGVLTASIRYEFDGLRAEQRFSARDVDDDRLAALAGAAGLRVASRLADDGRLMLLRPVP